jgi:hypothetical protein
MKRWAIYTVALYVIALLLLTIPVTAAAFGDWGSNQGPTTVSEILKLFTAWQYWLWLGVLVVGQVLLLRLPITIAERRLPARRPLKIPVIVTGFFLANLCLAGLLAVLCAIFRDEAWNVFGFADWLHGKISNAPPEHFRITDSGAYTSVTLLVLVFWTVWGLIFRKFAKADDEQALVKRVTRWLLRGSILELIVAVPSHVIVRRRDDCCAPMGTFWGITTGISVMLLCFGPGVYFLFVERMRKLKAKYAPTESANN